MKIKYGTKNWNKRKKNRIENHRTIPYHSSNLKSYIIRNVYIKLANAIDLSCIIAIYTIKLAI